MIVSQVFPPFVPVFFFFCKEKELEEPSNTRDELRYMITKGVSNFGFYPFVTRCVVLSIPFVERFLFIVQKEEGNFLNFLYFV